MNFRNVNLRWIAPLIIFLSIGFCSFSQEVENQNFAQSALTIEEIMEGYDFIGHSPQNVHWINNENIGFSWQKSGDSLEKKYSYNVKTKNLVESQSETFKASELIDKRFLLNKGNLYAFDEKRQEYDKILDLNTSISAVYRSANKENIYFVLDNQIFYKSSNSLLQISNFVWKSRSEENKLSSLELANKEVYQDAYISKKIDIENPKIYLGNHKASTISVDPHGKLAFIVQTDIQNNNPTLIMNYLANDGYAITESARPKVGENEDVHHLKFFLFKSNRVIDFDASALPGINIYPEYLKEYPNSKEYKRNLIFHDPIYAHEAEKALFEVRSLDNKDRWILLLDCETAEWKVIDHQHDEAWIGGPGIGNWNSQTGTLGWINDKQVYFQSEKTGFSHLYTYNLDKQEITALTSGNFEILEVQFDPKEKRFYAVTNRSHPGNRDLEIIDLYGESQSISNKKGAHTWLLSPDLKNNIDIFSQSNLPEDIYVFSLKTPEKIDRITNSQSNKFKAYSWHEPKVVNFTADDGVDIYSRVYEPIKPNGAAVIFIHGAGYLQNAHNYWSTYYREYMFHNFLRDQGYLVLDVDYRASEGYGRDYRTAIYRHMGGRDLDDILAVKKYIGNNYAIQTENVGIYGGSYGGFLSIMAMLIYPEEFKTAAALRSVTDWSHYNHEYTSNILNYPSSDSLAYRRSSPIFYAKNLEGELLMLHGMMDDNVQYQDVVRLSQAFIENRKHTWQLIGYPIERHGFKHTNSWIDEYTRVFKHFQTNILPK